MNACNVECQGLSPNRLVQSMIQNDKCRWGMTSFLLLGFWGFCLFFCVLFCLAAYLTLSKRSRREGESEQEKYALSSWKRITKKKSEQVLASPKARQATQIPPLPALYKAAWGISNLDFQQSGYALLTKPKIRQSWSNSAIWQIKLENSSCWQTTTILLASLKQITGKKQAYENVTCTSAPWCGTQDRARFVQTGQKECLNGRINHPDSSQALHIGMQWNI